MAKTEEKGTALTVMSTDIFNLSTIAEGSADVQDNLSQVTIRLPQIKIIHQAQMFEMPDGSKVQGFEGIMIDFNMVNSFWRESFDDTGGGTPPDCFSLDGVFPCPESQEVQSPNCATCPQNKFGSEVRKSGLGRGKACKNIKRVHIFTDSHQILPYRLTLPPSNLRAFDGYISNQAAQGNPWRMIWTRFELRPTKNKDGITYAELVLTPVKFIPREQVMISKEISKSLMRYLRDEVRQEEIS
jgi:hypothetical protein